MAGNPVSSYQFDNLASQGLIQIRDAFVRAENIMVWLENHPVPSGGPDPMIALFNYTAAECATFRDVYTQLRTMKNQLESVIVLGTDLIGLA